MNVARPVARPAWSPITGWSNDVETYAAKSGMPAGSWDAYATFLTSLAAIVDTADIDHLFLFSPKYNRGTGNAVPSVIGPDGIVAGAAWNNWGTAWNGTDQYFRVDTDKTYPHNPGLFMLYAGTTSFTVSSGPIMGLMAEGESNFFTNNGIGFRRQTTTSAIQWIRYVGTNQMLANRTRNPDTNDTVLYSGGYIYNGSARHTHNGSSALDTYDELTTIDPDYLLIGNDTSGSGGFTGSLTAMRPVACIVGRNGNRGASFLADLGNLLISMS